MTAPNPKADWMDEEIRRLTDKVAEQKAQTEEVVRDLNVRLRHNRILSNAVKVAMGVVEPAPLLLLPAPPQFHDH